MIFLYLSNFPINSWFYVLGPLYEVIQRGGGCLGWNRVKKCKFISSKQCHLYIVLENFLLSPFFKVSNVFSKSPQQMFLLPYKFGCWDPNKNHRENIFGGSWQKWKKNSGEGCDYDWNDLTRLSVINELFDIFHTPPLNFFFIFVRTRPSFLHPPFDWGSNNQIKMRAKNSVGGFLRNVPNFKLLYLAIKQDYWRVTQSRFLPFLSPKPLKSRCSA